MTPREQIEQRAEEYAWVGDMYDPKAKYKAGAEYGYNLAIERVEKILEDIDFEQRYLDGENLFDKELFIEELKQAMKL